MIKIGQQTFRPLVRCAFSRATQASMIQSQQQQRSLHITRPAQLDLFSFFRSRKEKEQVLAPKPQKTASLLKDIEQREASGETPQTLKPVELEVIGLPVEDRFWDAEQNGFSMEGAFPISSISPDVSLEAVKSTIYNISQNNATPENTPNSSSIPEGTEWMKQIDLLDFNTRFQFVKAVSRALNIAVPDSQLANIVNAEALYTYFSTQVAGYHYDPKRPDAIYLNPEEFEGTNITILPKPLSPKQREEKWQHLVEEAKNAEEQAARAAFEKL